MLLQIFFTYIFHAIELLKWDQISPFRLHFKTSQPQIHQPSCFPPSATSAESLRVTLMKKMDTTLGYIAARRLSYQVWARNGSDLLKFLGNSVSYISST